jgi:hypothetical protein
VKSGSFDGAPPLHPHCNRIVMPSLDHPAEACFIFRMFSFQPNALIGVSPVSARTPTTGSAWQTSSAVRINRGRNRMHCRECQILASELLPLRREGPPLLSLSALRRALPRSLTQIIVVVHLACLWICSVPKISLAMVVKSNWC